MLQVELFDYNSVLNNFLIGSVPLDLDIAELNKPIRRTYTFNEVNFSLKLFNYVPNNVVSRVDANQASICSYLSLILQQLYWSAW